MTHSIFDPDGGETERSGSQNIGPDAADLSQLPVAATEDDTALDAAAESADPDLEQLAKAERERTRQRQRSRG